MFRAFRRRRARAEATEANAPTSSPLLIGWTPPPAPLLPRPASTAEESSTTAGPSGEKGKAGAEGEKGRAEGEKESGLDRFACNIWCVQSCVAGGVDC